MTLHDVAPAFVDMAHRIVWATAASVDRRGRPRSRILHPIWEWRDGRLTGWIATGPTPIKRAHLAVSPNLSLNYWSPEHDTCVAECGAALLLDDSTRVRVWNLFKEASGPVGYDPGMIPVWTDPTAPTFAAIRLDPWYLRVFPGTVLTRGEGTVLTWRE